MTEPNENPPESNSLPCTVTPETPCPYCGHKLNRAFRTDGRPIAPKARHVTLCIECEMVLQFDDSLNLRKVSATELRGLDKDVLRGLHPTKMMLWITKSLRPNESGREAGGPSKPERTKTDEHDH